MSHFRITVATFLILAGVFSVIAQTTQTPSCQSLTGMANVNASLFTGHWYEEFRAPATNISCVQIDVNAANNQTQLNVTVMYSASKDSLLMNQFASAVVDISAINSNNGFSLTYDNNKTVTTYKIISTDYTSNAVLCGYTNASDPSTSFGFIATRGRIVNTTWLMQIKDEAAHILPALNGSLAGNVIQSLKCSTNSAASPVPAFAALFAAFYALVKLVH